MKRKILLYVRYFKAALSLGSLLFWNSNKRHKGCCQVAIKEGTRNLAAHFDRFAVNWSFASCGVIKRVNNEYEIILCKKNRSNLPEKPAMGYSLIGMSFFIRQASSDAWIKQKRVNVRMRRVGSLRCVAVISPTNTPKKKQKHKFERIRNEQVTCEHKNFIYSGILFIA